MVLSQSHLGVVLKHIFPGGQIILNARNSNGLVNPTTGNFLEIDFWCPKYKLCFEFQDAYHYISTWYSQIPITSVRFSDNIKRDMVRNLGETLITIPCWWDGTKESLISTIQFHRPDILPHFKKKVKPINLNYPFDYFKGEAIDTTGQLMLATFPLSRQIRNKHLISNYWWMGEKYDGVRACWNPKRKLLYTRGGIRLSFPASMVSLYTNLPMDTEIWFGRGNFPDSQRLVLSSEDNDLSQMRVIYFDVLLANIELEARYELMIHSLHETHPFLSIAPRVRCLHKQHLSATLKNLIKGGGEGLILHKGKSLYEIGRSACLFKIKATRGDQEALVLSSERKWTLLQLPDKNIFSLPSPSHLKLKQGDVVTFSFQNYSRREAPVNPKILHVRLDVSWEQVLREFSKNSRALPLNDLAQKVMGYTTKPQGYWVSEKGKNTKLILEAFAKKSNFDALLAKNWYSVDHKSIPGLTPTALAAFDGNFIKALTHLFPEVSFDESCFCTPKRQHWQNATDRRAFFDAVAHGRGLDPLVPMNWYSLIESVRKAQGAESVLRFYGGSVPKALLHLYPNIGLKLDKFEDQIPKSHWKTSKNRQAFLSNVLDPTELHAPVLPIRKAVI